MRPSRRALVGRLAGFAILPALAACSALAVLPIVSRQAGQAGWASALTGEALGTFAAIVITWGWANMGPAWVALARDDRRRGELYRQSLAARLGLATVVLPVLVVVSYLNAAPGYELLTVLMGLQGALIALSFTWFAVGLGDPRAIALLDAVPRVVGAALAAAAMLATGLLELYPLAGILVTTIGTGIYTRRVLRRYPAPWPQMRRWRAILRPTGEVAVNDASLGLYSAVPMPVVNATASAGDAASYASADKLVKLAQYIPLTLANALQAWAAEVPGHRMRRRTGIAVAVHAAIGLAGWAVLIASGPLLSAALFGADAAYGMAVPTALGLALFLFSVRTSLSRHVLLPVGRASLVMRSGLIGSVAGSVAIVVGALAWGPIGAAWGFACSEVVMVSMLSPASAGALRSATGWGQEPQPDPTTTPTPS